MNNAGKRLLPPPTSALLFLQYTLLLLLLLLLLLISPADGTSHGVFFLNSNGMDVLLNKTSVTFRWAAGSFAAGAGGWTGSPL
jgi:hypothetical protein